MPCLRIIEKCININTAVRRGNTKGETKCSRLEDVDIFGKGADDHIGLYVSSDLGSLIDGLRISIRCLCMPPDSRFAG